MKTLLRNFTHTFRRFFTASILNLIGLSIAFASFFIIMTQVVYEYTYNKGIKDHDRIYQVLIFRDDINEYIGFTCYPLAKLLVDQSSYIKSYSIDQFTGDDDLQYGDNIIRYPFYMGFDNFMEVFQPEMIAGNADAVTEQNKVLIPESLAKQLFNTTQAVGKHFFKGRSFFNNEMTVAGVYKDFPKNTSLPNAVYMNNPDQSYKESWSEWSFRTFIKIQEGSTPEQVKQEIIKGIAKDFKEKLTDGDDIKDDFVKLIPWDEIHFSTLLSKAASNMTSVYLLFCIAILIVVIATINFTNFNLAETPMRIKSINTQRVMGATIGMLKRSLVMESICLSLIAFLLACGWIYLFCNSSLQELIQSDASISNHLPLLVVLLAISIIAGILGGLYPAQYATSFPPALVLKGSFGLSPKGRILRTSLVCVQFFVSFVLIIAVGIMYLQSYFIQNSRYGYAKDEIIVCNMTVPMQRQQAAIINELNQLSGVKGVAVSRFVLSSYDNYMGWGRGEGEKTMYFNCLPVDYHYLDVMGIKITEGRNFNSTDGDVYIFNEAARKKYPWIKVGEQLYPNDFPVVGICENIKYTSFRNNDDENPMAFFIMGDAHKGWGWNFVLNIRVAKESDQLAVRDDIRRVLMKFDKAADTAEIRFMNQVLENTYWKEKLFIRQIVVFSVIAIIISLIGVFGLTMFESEYRRKEIGIRKIMGSSTSAILYMFNRRYLLILLGCFIVAAPFGWWMGNHWLQTFNEKTNISPWIFVVSFLAVTLVTMLTVTYQSWKNAHENPINSIKTE